MIKALSLNPIVIGVQSKEVFGIPPLVMVQSQLPVSTRLFHQVHLQCKACSLKWDTFSLQCHNVALFWTSDSTMTGWFYGNLLLVQPHVFNHTSLPLFALYTLG